MTAVARIVQDPGTDSGWELAAKSFGTLFNSPPWIRVLADAFEIPIRGILREDGSRTQGFLVADIDDACGVRQSTLPFSDYCDPLSATGAPDWAMLRQMIDADIPYSTRMCDNADTEPEFLEVSAVFARHSIDLERPISEIWDTLPSNARQGVRRASRSAVTACAETASGDTSLGGKSGLLDEFHRLHVGLRAAKFRMLAQPGEFFAAIGREFGSGSLALVNARQDSQLVAGILLLKWGDVAYYKFNASTDAGQRAHANDLCMWTAIEYAKEEWGCRTLDLGLSDLDQPGLIRYKNKYATSVGKIQTYQNDAAREAKASPVRDVINSAVGLVTTEGVPEEVRMRAASTYYRYFC